MATDAIDQLLDHVKPQHPIIVKWHGVTILPRKPNPLTAKERWRNEEHERRWVLRYGHQYPSLKRFKEIFYGN